MTDLPFHDKGVLGAKKDLSESSNRSVVLMSPYSSGFDATAFARRCQNGASTAECQADAHDAHCQSFWTIPSGKGRRQLWRQDVSEAMRFWTLDVWTRAKDKALVQQSIPSSRQGIHQMNWNTLLGFFKTAYQVWQN